MILMESVSFLVHKIGDHVGIATTDLVAGITSSGRFLDSGTYIEIEVKEHISMGHKMSIEMIAESQQIVEYGYNIGTALSDIHPGFHVHTHNLKSSRW